MSLFQGVENAKAQVGGNYIKPGDIIARINRVHQDSSRKNGDFVAIEMTVYHSFEGPHTPGEEVTHMLMHKFDSFLSNWKSAIMGITSCSEAEVTADQSEKLVSEEQPLSGMVVRVKAFNIVTRSGKDYTKVTYEGEVSSEALEGIVDPQVRSQLGI
jgi:hypothetical protein